MPGQAALLRGLAPITTAVLVFAVHLLMPGGVPWWQSVMASFSGVATAYSGMAYMTQSKFNRLPFMEFGLIQVYMFWGMPTLFADVGERFPYTEYGMTLAQVAIILFLVVMFLFYPIGKRIGARFAPLIKSFLPGKPGRGIELVFWPWLFLGMLGNSGLLARLPQRVMHLIFSVSSYFPILVYTALRSLAGRVPSGHFLLATAMIALSGMVSGRMRYVLLPLTLSGVLYLMIKKRFPWRMLGVTLVLFVILQPAKHAYRAMAWSQDKHRANVNVELTATRWYDAITSTWQGEEEDMEGNERSITTRLNLLAPIAMAMDMVPGVVPHVGFAHWKLLLVSPIPRFLYPEKPNFTEAINNHFSVTFGIQDEGTVGVSTAAFPIVIDGFWCFGWIGVVVVGILVGLVVGFSTTCFDLTQWTGLAFALSMFSDLRPLKNVVGLLGGIFQRFVGLAAICWGVWLFSMGFLRSNGQPAARSPRAR